MCHYKMPQEVTIPEMKVESVENDKFILGVSFLIIKVKHEGKNDDKCLSRG